MSATLVRETVRRLDPLERLEALCDPGSVRPLRSRVVSPRLGARAVPGDGVLGATGSVDGRPIACYAEDGSYLGGSLGERHADTIVRVLQTAARARIPVVGFVESGGARMQEGTAALAGYGRIFRETVALTGVVPQISVVSGASAGGGAYSPALTDLIIMTEDAAMFLTGPGVVREALGEEVSAVDLGGPRVHEHNGVCHLVARDELAAAVRVRDLLSYLPSAAGLPLPDASAVEASGTRYAGSSTPGRWSSCARGGRATWSRCWLGSRAGRWGSWPTSRITWRGFSMPRHPRRPPDSCRSATRSVCR